MLVTKHTACMHVTMHYIVTNWDMNVPFGILFQEDQPGVDGHGADLQLSNMI